MRYSKTFLCSSRGWEKRQTKRQWLENINYNVIWEMTYLIWSYGSMNSCKRFIPPDHLIKTLQYSSSYSSTFQELSFQTYSSNKTDNRVDLSPYLRSENLNILFIYCGASNSQYMYVFSKELCAKTPSNSILVEQSLSFSPCQPKWLRPNWKHGYENFWISCTAPPWICWDLSVESPNSRSLVPGRFHLLYTLPCGLIDTHV